MIMEMLKMRDEDEACPTTKTRTRTKKGWFFFWLSFSFVTLPFVMQCHNQNFLETPLTKAEQQAVGLSLGNKPWGWGEQKTNKLKGLLSIGQTDQTNHFHSNIKNILYRNWRNKLPKNLLSYVLIGFSNRYGYEWYEKRATVVPVTTKGATESCSTHYSCVVIVLFNAALWVLHFLQFLLED